MMLLRTEMMMSLPSLKQQDRSQYDSRRIDKITCLYMSEVMKLLFCVGNLIQAIQWNNMEQALLPLAIQLTLANRDLTSEM